MTARTPDGWHLNPWNGGGRSSLVLWRGNTPIAYVNERWNETRRIGWTWFAPMPAGLSIVDRATYKQLKAAKRAAESALAALGE